MFSHPHNSLCTDRTKDPAGRDEDPSGDMLCIARDDAADVHPAGAMDEVSISKVNTYVADAVRRAPEKEEIAFLQVTGIADIDRFPISGLLR